LLNCWLWTFTEHEADRHEFVTIVMATRGCTVSLGCSRRVDHRVIKMDLWPSFSQPNVREKQPLNIDCSQFHCYTFTSITYANLLGEYRMKATVFGANYSQNELKLCVGLKYVLSYHKASSNMSSSSEMDTSKQHTSTASSILSDG